MGDVKQGPHYYGELEEPFISPFMTGEIRIKHTFYIRYVKRAIDIIVSSAAILLTLPVNILIAATPLWMSENLFFSSMRGRAWERDRLK